MPARIRSPERSSVAITCTCHHGLTNHVIISGLANNPSRNVGMASSLFEPNGSGLVSYDPTDV